jgi:mono/diheme cytochrome c family protein
VKGFFLGVAAVVALFCVIGYIGVVTGTLIPANADATPGKLERWAARQSLKAAIAREAPRSDAPVAPNEKTFNAGIKIYGENCVACHGAADGRPSTIGFGLYQKAPLLGRHGVEDDPEGEIYWKVDHGIRLTGMPAFGRTLSDTQVWQVALFLKHMDRLPPTPEAKWKALKNPAMLVPPNKLPLQMRPKGSD